MSRVIYFSSAQVFGCAEGEGIPRLSLPIDDDHPVRAARPYGMSKRLAEEMCAAWSARTGIPTTVLRPVMVPDNQGLSLITKSQAEFGAFVHVDDVAEATALALEADVPLHVGLNLYGAGAFDTTVATKVLGWRPGRGWPTQPLA